MPDPTTPRTEPLPVCASSELVERGDAHVFDVLHFREPARAFVMRFEGRVVAYLNRCLHVPTEMDWQHGKFLDGDREYILEEALHADFALIRARTGDTFGNLRFYRTARNFSPVMATAARTTIAEIERLVPLGALDPDDVHLPGIYVHRVVEVREHEDAIEYRTVRTRTQKGVTP